MSKKTLGRRTERNVWKVERVLLDYPHQQIHTPDHRIDRWRARYRDFMTRFPDRKPLFFEGRERWSELPAQFRRAIGRGDTRRA